MSVSRSQITIAVNNDKTGYSLTAGSYSIRATSSQRTTRAFGSGDTSLGATISAVTVNQASYATSQRGIETADITLSLYTGQLTTTTNVQAVRGASGQTGVFAVEVWENLV
jgi:CO/xanthine dehydrogenase Mo-binding subunit